MFFFPEILVPSVHQYDKKAVLMTFFTKTISSTFLFLAVCGSAFGFSKYTLDIRSPGDQVSGLHKSRGDAKNAYVGQGHFIALVSVEMATGDLQYIYPQDPEQTVIAPLTDDGLWFVVIPDTNIYLQGDATLLRTLPEAAPGEKLNVLAQAFGEGVSFEFMPGFCEQLFPHDGSACCKAKVTTSGAEVYAPAPQKTRTHTRSYSGYPGDWADGENEQSCPSHTKKDKGSRVAPSVADIFDPYDVWDVEEGAGEGRLPTPLPKPKILGVKQSNFALFMDLPQVDPQKKLYAAGDNLADVDKTDE